MAKRIENGKVGERKNIWWHGKDGGKVLSFLADHRGVKWRQLRTIFGTWKKKFSKKKIMCNLKFLVK